MRLYRFDRLSSLDDLALHTEDTPRPQRSEVLVRVRAVSLNYRDIAIVQGNYPRSRRPGLVPTSDGAGEIAAVGEGVTAFREGDRVLGAFHPRWLGGAPPATMDDDCYGSSADGWLAEYKVVSQEAIVRVPDTLSFEQAATLPCAAATAWNALTGAKPIRAGDTVLTQGTGGVSIFAVQLAKAVGARVIATTSSVAKAERLKALGADEVIDYSQIADWGAEARERTGGRGVDRVVEIGGPSTLAQSIKAVASGGEVVLVGFLSNTGPSLDFYALFGSGATVRPIAVGDRAMLEDAVRAVSASGLQPVVDRVFGFDEAHAAFARLQAAEHIGKIVIRVA